MGLFIGVAVFGYKFLSENFALILVVLAAIAWYVEESGVLYGKKRFERIDRRD